MPLTGLLPVIAIVGFGLWHMYTLGLSVTVKGGFILVSMAFADVLLISRGAYLLSSQKNQTDPLSRLVANCVTADLA